MKYFITGITGFIGSNLASYLLAEGHQVNAIVRKITDTKSLSHPNLHLFIGDLHDKAVLLKAMQGCGNRDSILLPSLSHGRKIQIHFTGLMSKVR